MSDGHDDIAENDEEQRQPDEVLEKILDEIITKYGDTLRKLGES